MSACASICSTDRPGVRAQTEVGPQIVLREEAAAGANLPDLAIAGLTDPRVTYWEPAKWIAKLRAKNTSSNLVLLKTNMEAGHGGASGRFERLREIAIDYAFAIKIAGEAKA